MEMKQYEIKIECNRALYKAIILMIRHMMRLGSWGSSRWCSIYCDGDGADHIRQLWVSENVPNWRCSKEDGSFKLDTDEIYALERGEHPSQQVKGTNKKETEGTNESSQR